MKPRQDIWDALQKRIEGEQTYTAILKDLGLPEKYKSYISLMKKGSHVNQDIQNEFADALGLEPTLRRKFYRPTMATAWKPLLDELGMSVEDIVGQYVYMHWPQLWYLVPAPEEKGK